MSSDEEKALIRLEGKVDSFLTLLNKHIVDDTAVQQKLLDAMLVSNVRLDKLEKARSDDQKLIFGTMFAAVSGIVAWAWNKLFTH